MARELLMPDDRTIEVLPIHFDVPEHYIPLRTFIDTVSHTEEIVASLNVEWFAGELDYEVVVIPPKPGSFLIGLGIAVAGAAAVWKFLHSDVGKAFVRGLTGEEPAHWGEWAGKKVRERLTRKFASEQEASSDIMAKPPEPVVLEPAEQELLVQKTTTSIILVESTKTILMKEASELRRIGLDTQRFRETYEARNEFYQACWQDKELRAIGFDESNQFSIDRKDFARLQVPLVSREDATEVEPSTVELTSVTVTSPNWDRRDSTRTWRGREASGRYRYFKVIDESFWSLAEANQLNLQGLDTMKVQWAFQGRGRQARNFRVVRVLEYNGDHLADPYDDATLDGILGPHTTSGSNQVDLFGRP